MKGHWGCLTRLFLRAFVLSGSLLLFKILSPKDVFYNLPRLAAALAPGALHGQLRSLHGDMVTTAAPTAHFVMAMSSRKLVVQLCLVSSASKVATQVVGLPGLRLGDHPSLTILSHTYEPGFGSRQSWGSFVSRPLVVTVGMLTFPSSTSYSSDVSWKLGVKVESPFRQIPVGTFPLQTQRLR